MYILEPMPDLIMEPLPDLSMEPLPDLSMEPIARYEHIHIELKMMEIIEL